MGRGLGWVQQACLHAIGEYEAEGNELPTTYAIAATVYEVKPDEDGNHWVDDAQHVAVKRALGGLQRKGRIIGFRTQQAREPGYYHRTELCHHWMTEKRVQKFVKDTVERALKYQLKSFIDLAESVTNKMKGIGMKVPEQQWRGRWVAQTPGTRNGCAALPENEQASRGQRQKD
jgi:hypothetical protein